MTLYPCTKQPPCKNVGGHLTPVCPNDTMKGVRSSVSKLKVDAIKNSSKVKPNPNIKWADNPRAVEIDALIERAGRLTAREVKALNRVWDVGSKEAWYAASNAAERAGYGDVCWAAQDAAWHSAYSVASDDRSDRGTRRAAGDAAGALVIRGLIDEDTAWNQKAYDTITAPWAKVIGKVHPDD